MKKLTALLAILGLIGLQVAFAQTRSIKGTVTSKEDGMGLPGANVQVKGTTTGTATDFNGNFELNVPASATTLVFSSVGYTTVEMPVQDVVNVVLESDSKQIDEVVVVAYGTAKKSSFTGSAAAVKNEKLTRGSSESLDKALNGLVSGVRVSQVSGDPGSAGQINIRGVGSMNASKEPLYVIDGVAMASGDLSMVQATSSILSTINPSDIESLTVLKDAAAASLYGSRAANGVIIITTKKGKKGKAIFEAKASYGVSDMAIDAFNPLSGPDYANLVFESNYNRFLYNNKALSWQANAANAASYDAAAREYAKTKLALSMNLPADFNAQNPNWASIPNTNWKDHIFQAGKTEEYQFSATAGNELTTIFSSFSYFNQEGVAKGSEFTRLSGRLNVNYKLTDKLSLGVSEMIASTEQYGTVGQDGPGKGIAYANPIFTLLSLNPTRPAYNADGSINENVDSKFSNPISSQTLNPIKSNIFRSLSNVDLKYDIIENLSFKSVFGMDWMLLDESNFYDPTSKDGLLYQGMNNVYNTKRNTLTSSNTLNYNFTLGKDHGISLLAGFEVEDMQYNYINAAGKGYATGKKTALSNAAAPDGVGGKEYISKMASYFGKADYSYQDKYYASGSVRTDGSSRLGSDTRWGTFYSASASWRISKEAFMESVTPINDLRIKASYGTNGTLPTDYFGSLALYGVNEGYNGSPAIYPSQPGNSKLGWEKSKNFNVGMECTFLKDYKVSVDYFLKKTTDLLLDVPISYTSGFESSLKNIGEISNEGVEIELNATPVKTNSFSWTSVLTLTFQKSTIDKLYKGEDVEGDFPYLYREGYSPYSFWLREYAGVDPTNGRPMYIKNTGWKEGKVTSREKTYNPLEAEKVIVGNSIPDLSGGWENTLTYKDFSLSFLFNFQRGAQMYDNIFAGNYGPLANDGRNKADFLLDRWTKPGDNTDYGQLIEGDPTQITYNSSLRVKDSDFIRLRNVTLSYNLPSNLLSKIKVSSAQVYVQGSNLLTITDLKNVDPEVGLDGFRTYRIPPLKTIQVGVSFKF